MIFFSKHAHDKLKRRGILKEEVIYSIEYPDKQHKKQNLRFFQKNIGRGSIEVVSTVEKNIKVITVYWI